MLFSLTKQQNNFKQTFDKVNIKHKQLSKSTVR